MKCANCGRPFIHGLDGEASNCPECDKPWELAQEDDGWSKAIAGLVDDEPHSIWVVCAARQLGFDSMIKTFKTANQTPVIAARVPAVAFDDIMERAWMLAEREEQGLPTEPLPSGRWPKSEGDFGETIQLQVGIDELDKLVVMDFGRPVKAVSIHPSVARFVATMLQQRASKVDPDGQMGMKSAKFLGAAKVVAPDGRTQESDLKMGDLAGMPKLEDEDGQGA
jgi:hypothetical protein